MTHYIPYFTKPVGSKRRAACGELVERKQHSTEPACVDCVAYLERDAEIADGDLLAPDPEFMRPVASVEFNPVAGYTPRGGVR